MGTNHRRRAVIFDLDGTLADTLGTIACVANEALARLGFPAHAVQRYATMVGDGVVKLCERALPEDRHDQLPALLMHVREIYPRRRSDGAALYDGMRELLLGLKERGARLGVLSNKPHDLTLGTLRDLGIETWFDAVLGQTEERPPKPHPAGLEHLLAELRVERPEALYVGDTATDMQTARAARLRAVGVLWGFRGRDELLDHGADHLAAHPREILRLYEQVFDGLSH